MEPCLVVLIKNRLTLSVATVIIRQMETKTIIWRLCRDAQNKMACIVVNFVIIMNSLFKLLEILAWIIRSGIFDAKQS